MIVGVDYLPAVAHAPGVGRGVRELVRALIQLHERPDLRLFEIGRATPVMGHEHLGFEYGDPRVRRVQRRIPRRALRLAAQLTDRGADDWLGQVDVFHHVLPRDLHVRRARQSFALSELPPHDGEAEIALRPWLESLDLVLTYSADAKSRLLTRFHLDPARVAQVSVGCEHWRRTLVSEPERASPPRIVSLGAVRAGRRHTLLLAAFERVRARGIDARLRIVATRGRGAGRGRASAERELEQALAQSPAAAHVDWSPAGDADDPQQGERHLPRLVGESACLVHVCDDALTPVTPLEALALGVPVVVSRVPAFEEALGQSARGARVAHFVDNASVQREPGVLADAIALALDDAARPEDRAARTLRAREFTWERCARATLAAWKRTLER